jgi:hypothetical protein
VERTAAVEKALKQQLNRSLVSFVSDPGKVGDTFGRRQGVRLWDWLLLVVLLIGLFEPWLANRISARLFARQLPAPALTRAVPASQVGSPTDAKALVETAEARTR